ncbi:MAG: 50S ribosomal protein L30 [Candidatus Stahlbacteria bacterium]|nr:50S ribosomal protein L30 [Candidatus Stahlbacteria bacterium]
MKKQVKITQTKSAIGSNWRKKRTVEALGLSKLHHSVIHNDTPTIRGMIKAVRELVKVEEVELK